jgi:phenylpyruvate tautomerase PptA (4-oxalocrotonate tautomerase family)
MPLIKVQTSAKIQDKASLALELSKICAQVIRKPESYVQSIVEDDAVISMGGAITDSAFVEVKSIGGLNSSVNKELSQALCRVLEEKVKIKPSSVYINFSDVSASNWGNNSTTFG